MRRRRRYEVVVEGLSGQAAAQRSVVAEHRSEDAAIEDARNERNRLEVIYGEAASAWRVVVLRDDEVIAEERPAGGATPPLARPSSTPVPSLDEEPATPETPEAEGRTAPEPEEPDARGPVPDWLIEKVEESIARQDRRREREEG